MKIKFALSALAAASLLLGACPDEEDTGSTDTTNTNTGDTSNTNTGDTSNTNTGDTTNTNTGDTTNTNTGDTTNTNTGDTTNTGTCGREGFTGVTAEIQTGETAVGLSLSNAEGDVLSLEFYSNTLTGPGTFPIGAVAAEQNYATCNTCVMIYTENATYFATEGSINVTAYDGEGSATATLTGAKFVEVTIDENDFTSTPVANGGTWCIDTATFDYTLGCTSSFECTGATPICSEGLNGTSCVAGSSECTGDDSAEDGDDGPTGATALTIGTSHDAAICNADNEADWYTFTVAEDATSLLVHMAFAADDLDFYVFDGNGSFIDGGFEEGIGGFELVIADFDAGDYYIQVDNFDANGTVATAYSLQVAEPACSSSFTCFDSSKPICTVDASGFPVCGNLDADCTGDDAADNMDDGPSGATTLTAGTAASAKICDIEGVTELDYYTFNMPSDGNATVTVAWPTAGQDIDFVVYDALGGFEASGGSSDNPEVEVMELIEGDYFIAVESFDGAADAAVDYNITVTID